VAGDKLRPMSMTLVSVTRWWWVCGVALTASAAGGNGCASEGCSPNIILITLDTTRADEWDFLGSTRGLTPNLDALAHQSWSSRTHMRRLR